MTEHWKKAKYRPPRVRLIDSLNEPEELVLVLKAHLWLENLLDRLFGEAMDLDEFDLDRVPFARKLNLARALRLVPPGLAAPIRIMNKMRNSLAHDLDAKISPDDVRSLLTSCPEWIQEKIVAEHDDDPPLDQLRHLFAAVIVQVQGLLRLQRDQRAASAATQELADGVLGRGPDPAAYGESDEDFIRRRVEEDRAARKHDGEP